VSPRFTWLRCVSVGAAAALTLLGFSTTSSAQDVTGRLIYVVAPAAKVMQGATVIGTVTPGHRSRVLRTSGEWYLITLADGTTQGWIHHKDVLLEPALTPAQWQEHDKALELHLAGLKSYEQGKPEEALAAIQKALAVRKRLLGDEHPSTADSLNDVGVVYRSMGDSAKAEEFYRQALLTYKKVLGLEHPKTASTLSNLGIVYFERADYAKAEPLYRQALELRRKMPGQNRAETASSLNNLGMLYKAMGNAAKAEPLFQEALEIDKQVWGLQHANTARTLANLAVSYYEIGDYTRAEPLYLQALQINKKVGGEEHPAVAACLNDLGLLYANKADYAKAEPLLKQALEIRKRLGENRAETANSLNALGYLYFHMRQFAKAEPLYQQALSIQKKVLGENHLDTATSLNNLGALYVVTDQYAKAEPFYQQAIEIRKKLLGEEHPETAFGVDNLANLYQGTGQGDKAEPLYEKSRRISRRYVAHTLPGLEAREQMLFLGVKDRPQFFRALSFGSAQREHARVRSLAAGWLLNGKAVALEAAAQRNGVAAQVSDEALAILAKVNGILKELGVQNLQELAKLNLESLPPEERKRHIRAAGALAEEVNKLKREFDARGFSPDEGHDPWVSTESVRREMPAGSMLVEIARFSSVDFKANAWKPARYVAWLIPPAGDKDVHVVDLGDAETIERAVAGARRTLSAAPESIRKLGEPDAEKEVFAALRPLAEQVFTPILAKAGDAKHLILSPDGALWLVPWEALPLADGKYAVEEYRMRYVVSGRDLVTRRAEGRKIATADPLIMADPDYDLSPELARAETRTLLRGRPGTVQKLLVSLGGQPLDAASPPSGLPNVGRLPGTAVEAQFVAPSVKTYAQAEPRMYTGGQALEGVFKAARSPRLVVLSTHGFFLQDEETEPALSPSPSQPQSAKSRSLGQGKPPENPLLRCGLMLAGCNKSGQAKPGDEDGILTGLEIVGTDLRGTELVVLSACETGVGEVHHGEGVAGLRQSFQLAGAQSVVASLWQVPDRETARLISAFFVHLAAGESRADALRRAQLNLIQSRRQQAGAAHPYFWAAFTFTGQDRPAR
jgi:CHAT domain-containing protein/tetratricopeptide (TPR) repeat protein